MADVTIELLKTHFRQLRLPTMGQEFETLARDAAAANQTFRPVPAAADRARTGRPRRQRGRHPDQERRLPGREGLRHLRLHRHAAPVQAQGPGAGALRVD